MPQLKPEDTTMVGLTLFNQLCQLARIANAQLDNPVSDEQVLAAYVVWLLYLNFDAAVDHWHKGLHGCIRALN